MPSIVLEQIIPLKSSLNMTKFSLLEELKRGPKRFWPKKVQCLSQWDDSSMVHILLHIPVACVYDGASHATVPEVV